MSTDNNLYREADSDSSPNGNPISETTAAAFAVSPDENKKLFWNSRQPLHPGYDPVPVFFHAVTGSTATFSLVSAKTGKALKTEKYQVDLKDKAHCYSDLPSTPRPDSSALGNIVILMLAPAYHQNAKSNNGMLLSELAVEGHIALTATGKWPGTEAAQLANRVKDVEDLLRQLVDQARSPQGLTFDGVRDALRTKLRESSTFRVPEGVAHHFSAGDLQ